MPSRDAGVSVITKKTRLTRLTRQTIIASSEEPVAAEAADAEGARKEAAEPQHPAASSDPENQCSRKMYYLLNVAANS
jgi:hypothetical protein